MYKTILVPVDLSDMQASEKAVSRAVEMVKLANGSLHLLNVRSIVPMTYMEFMPATFEDEQQNACEEKLAAFAKTIPLDQSKVSFKVLMGSIYHEVLEEATHIKADLIVVGSHHPTMSTYFLGSNASTIVRHAHCSVLVVRE